MNSYIVLQDNHQLLSVVHTEDVAELQKEEWSKFLNSGSVSILPVDEYISSLLPTERIFRIYSSEEGITANNVSSRILWETAHQELPHDRQCDVPHFEELENGRYSVELFLEGKRFKNIESMYIHSLHTINDALKSYLDASRPVEQSRSVHALIMVHLAEAGSDSISNILRTIKEKYCITENHTFNALTSLAKIDMIEMTTADEVTMKTRSRDLQDQVSSYDGEVIL